MKCAICGGETESIVTSIDTQWGDYKISIHGVKALQCSNCQETCFDADEVEVIQALSAGIADNDSIVKPEVLNVEEVADILKVTKQTIYNMLRDGRLKAFKFGREWRFRKEDILNLLNSKIAAS